MRCNYDTSTHGSPAYVRACFVFELNDQAHTHMALSSHYFCLSRRVFKVLKEGKARAVCCVLDRDRVARQLSLDAAYRPYLVRRLDTKQSAVEALS